MAHFHMYSCALRTTMSKTALVLACLVVATCARVRIPANDEAVAVIGRYDMLENGDIAFDWPGVMIESMLVGSGASVWLNDTFDGNRYGVFLNGSFAAQVNTTPGVYTYELYSGLTPAAETFVNLVKFTEADYNAGVPTPSIVTFGGFEIDGDGRAFKYPRASVGQIEFIGDSITCGFGDEGLNPCNASPANENNYLAWGWQTCFALGATCHIEAWSGKGLVVNNNQIGPIMPTLFQRTIATDPNSQWDFSRWIPDAVVVNLGTNDFCCNHAPSNTTFGGAYLELIHNLTNAYGADTNFFLGVGPMSNAYEADVQQVIAQCTKEGISCTLVDMTNVYNMKNAIGCSGHPSAIGQGYMSAIAVQAISGVMGWPILAQ